ncbi:Methylthioadenosine phosphorylase [Serendipita vermifera]|nr:Methylthioadenosine phosphorylase [Serendipita vermifera]
MTEYQELDVVLGIIGGSGLYHLDQLTFVKEIDPTTPWGKPSSPITISSIPTGEKIAFIARHGTHHTIQPSVVPFAANIAALKHLGVKAILAFSAVGSLKEEIRPGDFIIPDQIIDRTKGVRQASFFDGTKMVAHAAFGDPFSKAFSNFLTPLVENALKESSGSAHLHTKKTVVCMEGPLFSTRAESNMYRAWGGDIINMSVLPEAKLAREAEISYALIATATDYDAWREGEEPVTLAEIIKTLHTNAEMSRKVASAVIAQLHAGILSKEVVSDVDGSMKYAVVTQPSHQNPEDRQKLAYILPYFGDEST